MTEKAMQNRQVFISRFEAEIKELGSQIDDLEAKIEPESELGAELSSLRAQEQELRDRLQMLKQAQEEGWQELRPQVETAMRDCENSVADLAAKAD